MQFKDYVVVPLRDLGESVIECEEHEAEFYGLMGVGDDDSMYAVGDFNSRADAEFIRTAILGG